MSWQPSVRQVQVHSDGNLQIIMLLNANHELLHSSSAILNMFKKSVEQ